MSLKNNWTTYLIATCSILLLSSCGAPNDKWQKSPIDIAIRDLSNEQNFSIILYDMDADGNKYYHKYLTVIERPDTVLSSTSEEWQQVSSKFFNDNVDNMGMEIATKKDGVLSKVASPAGYNHYVGNERYGRWQTGSNGSSFWEFYGRYAFMSSMFNMMHRPTPMSYYNSYNRGGYYGSRPYYGNDNSNRAYGTQSYTSSQQGKSSSWGSKPNSFKEKVRSDVKRSTSRTQSTKTSRSSSRYNSSSSRSRSGGSGK